MGRLPIRRGRSGAEVSLKRYRHTEKERDEETGFNYHGARYYASWLGRWTATDPGGLVDGANLYRYSRNSPLCYVDPQGMDPSDVTVAFGIFNIPLKDGRIFKQTGDVVAQAASNTGQKAVTISDLASTKGFDARIAPDKGKVWQALDPKVKGQVWTQDASGKWLPSSQSAPPIPNGLQSSTFFQQVVAGKAKTTSGESMTSVHFETTDIDPLMTAGHPESELRSAIATTAAGQHEIDVYFYERGKLSKLPAGSNIVEGESITGSNWEVFS